MPSTPRKTTKMPTAQQVSAPEPPDSKYAPNTWLSSGSGGLEDLTVPSGQICLVRRPGLEGLLKAGVLKNLDTLSAIVDQKHLKKTAKGKSPKINVQTLLGDEEALADIMRAVDKVLVFCVVKPEIHLTPDDETRRQPGQVYADMVGIEDKMFIFNYVVGGTRDLETFRAGLDESLGGVETLKGVPDEAE
jgi:hypothetical protein